jgi:hypothetical protein
LWQAWRWFDLELLRAAWRLVAAPGHVAREYVLGARKRHVHPLKLLLFASGVLLLVLTRSQGLETQQAMASRAMELLRGWSNWSFSLGVPATFAASWCLFRRYRGYNATEHLVLATYAQFLVLCASSLNRLPTLAWRTPEFLAAHKAWLPWFMDAVGVAVLSLACRQFFQLELRRDGVRLLAACALFLALKWLLQRGYAWLLVRLVLAP